jgi:hypothetical protein
MKLIIIFKLCITNKNLIFYLMMNYKNLLIIQVKFNILMTKIQKN